MTNDGACNSFFRKMRLQLHRIVQNAANLHDVRFGDAVKQEMARLADPVPGPPSGLAAEKEMIGSAMFGDFWPFAAAGKFWIRRDLLNRCRNELSVTLQGLWAKILFRPGKDARDVAARPRSDNDFHFLNRRSLQLSS